MNTNAESKTMNLFSGRSRLLGCASVALLHVSCGVNSGSQIAEIPGYQYPGVSVLSVNEDGTYLLSWPSAPAISPSYRIFMRQGDESFQWDKPWKTVTDTAIKTDDLRFSAKTCYAVRYYTASVDLDKNVTELCTPGLQFVFSGLDSLERSEAGRWIAKWKSAPFKNVSYQIFEASSLGGLSAKPLREVYESQASIGPFSIGEVRCFAVRMVVPSQPGIDVNTVQKCTDGNKINGFAGVESAVSRETGKVTLNWTATDHPDVTGYVIYGGIDFNQVLGTVSLRQLNNFTIADLPPGTPASFGVRAVSRDGSEDANRRVTTVTVADMRPLAFSGLLSASVSGKSEVLLGWENVSGASEYRIYAASGELASTPSIDWSKPFAKVPAAQGNTLRLTGFGDEMRHVFAVRSVSKSEVEDVNSKTITVDFPDQGSPVFAGLKSAKLVDGKVQLTWAPAVGQVSRYKIFKAKGPASALVYTSTSLPSEPGSATSTLVSGFQANQPYSFAVRAEDKNGNSDLNTVALTVTPGTQTLPEFLGYIGGQGIDERSVRLTFNVTRDGNVAQYRVRARRFGTTTYTKTLFVNQDLTQNSLTAVVDSLDPKTNYEILVTAQDLWGNESSNDVGFQVSTLDLTPPTFGGVVGAQQVAGSPDVTISWAPRPSVDIDHYRVYWSQNSLSGLQLGVNKPLPTGVQMSGRVDGASSSYKFTGLVKGVAHYFIVHALDAVGNEESNATQVSIVVLNSFPSLSASVSSVRTPEMIGIPVIQLSAADVDAGDTLTISRLSTTCSSAFDKPLMTVQSQNGKTRSAAVTWTPSSGFIDASRTEKSCTEIYQVSDGESVSPTVVVTFTAYNRAPRNVTAAIAAQSGGYRRNRNLDCSGAGDDDDGNPLTWTFQWLKNGNPIVGATSASLTPAVGAFLPGDSLVCQVAANDSHTTVSAQSTAVVFANDAPVIGSVSVSKDGGSLPVLVGDRVACNWSGSDADGDPLTFGAVTIESSPDGLSPWTEQSLDVVSCGIIQSNRKCFTVSTAVRRQNLRCKLASVSDGFVTVNTPAVSSGMMFVVNSAPKINSVSLTPSSGFEVGTQLACLIDISDLDGDSVAAPQILWTRDNTAIIGATGLSYTITSADRNRQLRCEVSLLTNADGFGSAAQGPIKSAAKTYSNSNPRIQSVSVSPASGVASGTNLNCQVGVVDPDGDTLNLLPPYGLYSWVINDGSGDTPIMGQTGQTLLVTPDMRGRNIKCLFGLAANADGQGSTAIAPVAATNGVVPANSPPTISQVSITASASPAVTGTVLTCNKLIQDADGDNVVELPKYLWKANGITISGQSNSVFTLRKTERNKAVTCSVQLPANSDGRISPPVSEVVSSNSITSINSEPTVADILVVSTMASPYYPGTDFFCQVGSINDADGDTPTPSFRWLSNGVAIPGATGQIYYATSADRLMSLSCQVELAANADANGSLFSQTSSLNSVFVGNRDPNNSFKPVLENLAGGSIYKESTLSCRLPTLSALDADGDATTIKYIWRKGGNLLPGTSSSGTTSSTYSLASDSSIASGDMLTCQAIVSDGLSVVLSQVSTTVPVINRAPVIAAGSFVTVSPATVYAASITPTLTCSGATFTDPEGENITLKYNWKYRPLSSQTFIDLAINQSTNTLTNSVALSHPWVRGDEIECQIVATDSSGSVTSTNWFHNNASSASSVTVLNSEPVGTLKCNNNVTSVVGFSEAPISPTASCFSSGTNIIDGDGDVLTIDVDSDPAKTTCADIGTRLLVDAANGQISGYMPASPCQITLLARDVVGALARVTTGGAVSQFTIQFTMPFMARMVGSYLDTQCRLNMPTSFTAGTVAYGSSTFSMSGLALDPKSHVGASTTSGVIQGRIDPATGGGPVLVSWSVTGASGGVTQLLERSVNVMDAPAVGAIPSTPVSQPGLQVPPALDSTLNRAAGCALADCTGSLGNITAGMNQSCAVSASGDLYCWGDNLSGELGLGNSTTPSSPRATKVNLGTLKARMVSGGGLSTLGVSHTCAVLVASSDGANKGVYCWGDNSVGQLGRGTITSLPDSETTLPAQVQVLTGGTGNNEIVAVSSGGTHTCALKKELSSLGGSAVFCWGGNSKGQLGEGTTQDQTSPVAVLGYASAGAKSVSSGGSHTCLVTAVGTVACWGNNQNNQLGVPNLSGDDTFRSSPVTVPNLFGVVAVAAGDKHTCAILNDGAVKCWGSAQFGQLGEGSLGGSFDLPRPFTGSVIYGKKAIALASGGSHTCALIDDGSVKCWGYNGSGQLGDNSTTSSPYPIEVSGLNNAALAIELGANHSCVLKNNGGVSCFGYFGGLGLDIPQKKPLNNAMPITSVTPQIPGAQFKSCRVLRAVEN